MWFAVFVLAPGFFLPLEQELGRALSHRRAVGDGGQPVVQKVVRLGAILVAIVTVVIILFSPSSRRRISTATGSWSLR